MSSIDKHTETTWDGARGSADRRDLHPTARSTRWYLGSIVRAVGSILSHHRSRRRLALLILLQFLHAFRDHFRVWWYLRGGFVSGSTTDRITCPRTRASSPYSGKEEARGIGRTLLHPSLPRWYQLEVMKRSTRFLSGDLRIGICSSAILRPFEKAVCQTWSSMVPRISRADATPRRGSRGYLLWH